MVVRELFCAVFDRTVIAATLEDGVAPVAVEPVLIRLVGRFLFVIPRWPARDVGGLRPPLGFRRPGHSGPGDTVFAQHRHEADGVAGLLTVAAVGIADTHSTAGTRTAGDGDLFRPRMPVSAGLLG